jgi:hypothetical protein
MPPHLTPWDLRRVMSKPRGLTTFFAPLACNKRALPRGEKGCLSLSLQNHQWGRFPTCPPPDPHTPHRTPTVREGK